MSQLQNRFRELANKAYQQNIFTFTGFLSLAEQDIFWKMAAEFSQGSYSFSGGTKEAERQMIRFGNSLELMYEEEFPISCIKISPAQEKFAQQLSHRDFLGALMNLGIERSLLGDIFQNGTNGYLFCLKNISEFICLNLDKVKNTNVRCKIIESQMELPKAEPTVEMVTISSPRVDSLISKVFCLSRGTSQELFGQKKVFVEGIQTENYSRLLKEGEKVNVRGFGKFTFCGTRQMTKKGKYVAEVAVFR